MDFNEAISRAESELHKTKKSLDIAVKRNAPQQDIANLSSKLQYRKLVLATLETVASWESGSDIVMERRNATIWK